MDERHISAIRINDLSKIRHLFVRARDEIASDKFREAMGTILSILEAFVPKQENPEDLKKLEATVLMLLSGPLFPSSPMRDGKLWDDREFLMSLKGNVGRWTNRQIETLKKVIKKYEERGHELRDQVVKNKKPSTPAPTIVDDGGFEVPF